MSVLIDTNILIYAWDSGNKIKQTKAIETLATYGHKAVLSTQNLSEFSSFAIRNGRDHIWLNDVVTAYSELMSIVSLRGQDIITAIQGVERYQMSFWDAQIWAVALRHKIPLILSEDGPTDQTIEGVTYRNPLL